MVSFAVYSHHTPPILFAQKKRQVDNNIKTNFEIGNTLTLFQLETLKGIT